MATVLPKIEEEDNNSEREEEEVHHQTETHVVYEQR